MDASVKERATIFGDGAALLGIVSPAGAVDPGRPAVLLLNAGIVYRVGPARNTVKLARRLARDGFLALRFDLSGLGDSEARDDALSMEEHASLDIRQAMDHLAKTRGVSRFVLVGLCSGADNGLRAAVQDPRVVGCVLMDGYGYRTPGYFLRYYGRRLGRWESWVGFGRRMTARLEHRLSEWAARARRPEGDGLPTQAARVPQWQRKFPPRAAFEADLRELLERGVAMYFIYTSAMESYYNYQEQFQDAFPRLEMRGLIDTRFFESTDHTFTERHNQRALIDAVAAWTNRRFPLTRAQAAATPPVETSRPLEAPPAPR